MRCAPDPVGQRGSVKPHALSNKDLRLPVQGAVIGIFGHEHVRHQGVCRQPAFDQPGGCGRLDDAVRAGAARVLRPAHHQYPNLRRHNIKTFGYILANPVQRGRAAGARAVRDVDHALDPRQMRRQGAAVRAALLEAHHTLGWRLLLGRGLVGGLGLLRLFQAEQQLVGRQALGAATEAVTLEFADDLAEPLVLDPLGGQHGLQGDRIIGDGGLGCAHDADQNIFEAGWRPPRRPPTRLSSACRCRRYGRARHVHATPIQTIE